LYCSNQEVKVVEAKFAQAGIPKPVSFAYPAYVTNAEALSWLLDRGYFFARVGGETVYRPAGDDPLLIPNFRFQEIEYNCSAFNKTILTAMTQRSCKDSRCYFVPHHR